MAQTIEVDLGAILERIEQNQIELKVGLATLAGKVDTLTVEVQNIKEDVKELKTEQKAIRAEVSGLYRWVIGLILGLGTLLLKAFDFFPNP